MATVSQPGFYNLQAFSSLGALAAGYRIYTYTQGTTTKKTAYTDSAGVVAHTYTTDSGGGEYIALDARGELPAPLYLTSGAYDICLKTDSGATVWTRQADPTGANLAAATGAEAVTYTSRGTGAVSRSVKSTLDDEVWLHKFSSTSTVTAAGLQLAINEVQGSDASIKVRGNTTIALGNTPVEITGAVKLVGVGGRNRTFLTYTGTTMDAIQVATDRAFQIEGFTISGPSNATAGSSLNIVGNGTLANSSSRIIACRFDGGYRQIDAHDAYVWEISGNSFSTPAAAGIYIGNTTNVDAGDSILLSNSFANMQATASCVQQISSGGLRVVDNKFNGGIYGYLMDLEAGAHTSILMMMANSFENQTTAGVRLINTAGGADFTHAMFVGNMFANQPTPILLNDATAFLSLVTIIGNSITGTAAGSTALISITNVPRVIAMANNLYGFGTAAVGITLGSGVTSSRIEGNLINGCVIDVADASTNTITAANALVIPSGKDSVVISGNTQINSINLGKAIRGRTLHLAFSGTPTVKHGTSNIKLSGAADFVATADDTLSLTCFDGTNWSETGRAVI